MEVQNKAIEELNLEIEKVKNDISKERGVLKRLKNPRTTNVAVRNSVSLKRAKSKKYIDSRREYLKELLKRKAIVASVSSTKEEVMKKLKKVPEEGMSRLYNQLSLNVENKRWTKEMILQKLGEEKEGSMIEEIVSVFLEGYELQNLLSK